MPGLPEAAVHDGEPSWIIWPMTLSFAKILSACDFNSIERCHPQANRDSTIG